VGADPTEKNLRYIIVLLFHPRCTSQLKPKQSCCISKRKWAISAKADLGLTRQGYILVVETLGQVATQKKVSVIGTAIEPELEP
jgi:hypothetical protein